METFSALLDNCAGNSPVTGEFPAQRPVTRTFDVFFDLWLNKRLSKQSWDWWFETPSCSLWRHYFDERVGVSWGTTSVGTLATFCYFYSSVFFLRNIWCSYENDFVIAPPTCCKSQEETNYSAEWWHWVFLIDKTVRISYGVLLCIRNYSFPKLAGTPFTNMDKRKFQHG